MTRPIVVPPFDALYLQDRMWNFAEHEQPQREAVIARLIDLVFETANPETLETLVEYPHNPLKTRVDHTLGLRQGIERTLRTPFEVDGAPVIPWEGGHTVVALDKHATVVAAQAAPQGRVYQKYGNNLFPYALSKAIAGLHLSLSGLHGGLGNRDNRAYLARLIPGRKQYEGEALGADGTILGASGCELRAEYINGLLPEPMRDQYSVDFLAGHADAVFAREVILSWRAGIQTHQPVPEPPLFADLRGAH